MRTAALLIVCASLIWSQSVWADAIDTRARQLRTSKQYKVRLSAALWLSKRSDERSVAAMTHALRNDRAKLVRRVAALSLPKLIDGRTPDEVRDRAIDALERAAEKDRDKVVRAKARTSWAKVRRLRSPASAQGGVFVAVGMPTAGDRVATARTRAAMQGAIRGALRAHAPDFAHATSRDGLPTRRELSKSGSRGFFVNASVASVKVRRSGARAVVSCEVSMRVNPWTGSDGNELMRDGETASARGRGSVHAGSDARSIASARRDCVLAVVESVTSRQVIPFVKRAADRRVALQRRD